MNFAGPVVKIVLFEDSGVGKSMKMMSLTQDAAEVAIHVGC